MAALRDTYPPEKEALGVNALGVDLSYEGQRGTRRYEAVLFDMGYTLVYFEPAQQVIVQEALRRIGVERSADEIVAAAQKVWGEHYRGAEVETFPATPEYDGEVESGLQRGLLQELGVVTDESLARAYYEGLEAWFARPGVVRPYPEVPDVLSALEEQGYRLGIVSNWSWNLRDRVRQAGLDGAFEVVWASAYAGCSKPHPGIFYQALIQMDIPADRALYVGDSYEHDVRGARNAGVDVAWLDREGSGEGADCPVIEDLWGLFPLLHSGQVSSE